MDGRLTGFEDDFDWQHEGAGEPQAIGDILADLLGQFQARFPEVNITVVEVSAAALTYLPVPVSWDSLNGLKDNVKPIAGSRSVTLTRGCGPMRIFSLATDQAVAVGDDIVVKVLEINGDEVQLGIEHSDGTLTEFDWVDKSRRQVEMEPVP